MPVGLIAQLIEQQFRKPKIPLKKANFSLLSAVSTSYPNSMLSDPAAAEKSSQSSCANILDVSNIVENVRIGLIFDCSETF